MAYYPKSQIKSNLYTNGGEYILSTTKKDYKGYYYEVSNGQKYTGKTPQDGANILLITPPPTPLIFQTGEPVEGQGEKFLSTNNPPIISALPYNNTPTPVRYLPLSNPKTPTDQEIFLGVYTRYFCKKNNELKYIEIDKTTFDKLKTQSKDIAWDLYTPISTLWYLKRDSNPYPINKGLISQIEQKQGWHGFTQWFKDKF
jgi:hypothetical protein